MFSEKSDIGIILRSLYDPVINKAIIIFRNKKIVEFLLGRMIILATMDFLKWIATKSNRFMLTDIYHSCETLVTDFQLIYCRTGLKYIKC